MSPPKSLTLFLILSLSTLLCSEASSASSASKKPSLTEEDSKIAHVDQVGKPSTKSSLDIKALKAICNKVAHRYLCMSSIQAEASGPVGSTNAATILQLGLKASVNNTQTIIDEVRVLAEDPATAGHTNDVLRRCIRDFDDALADLEEASKAMETNDRRTVIASLHASLGSYIACRTGFDGHILATKIQEYQDMLQKLAENNLRIAKIVWP